MPIASIQQPQYFPWLGYFEQLKQSDTAMLLDCVQWTKQGRQHRCVLQNPAGERSWLTIPVHSKNHRTRTIREMRIDASQAWKQKHWRKIEAHYRHSPFFASQLEPLLYPWFATAPCSDLLADNLEESLKLLGKVLQVNHEFQLSSHHSVEGKSTDRLVNLCVEIGADTYYSSLGSTPYLELAKFRPYEIRVITQHWNAPGSVGNLSVIHALAEIELQKICESLELKAWRNFGKGHGSTLSL